MVLKLEVVNDPSRREPTAFRDAGGTLGRGERCTLTLPDPFVSNSHARIIHRDGTFLIEDTSSNGVAVNSPSNRLVKGEPYELSSGDLLIIDPYEIRVTIEDPLQPQPAKSMSDPFGPASPTGENWLIDGPNDRKKKGPVPRVADLPRPNVEQQLYQPPQPILPVDPEPSASPNIIPDNWDLTNSGVQPIAAVQPKVPTRPVDPTPARIPSPPSVVETPRGSGELSEVLQGAGLPADLVTPELARDFGVIIRTMVAGLMEVLKSRQQIKDEFRMHQTKIETTGNNPLKFSANLEDALHRLLLQRNRAYLEPVAAFEDAFDDLQQHQMATLAAMRAAFDAMLKAFDPEVLQAEFDKTGKGGLISGPAKLRYWEQYRAKFGDMVRDADCFQNLFGEEFASAYDEQLDRLKEGRKSRR